MRFTSSTCIALIFVLSIELFSTLLYQVFCIPCAFLLKPVFSKVHWTLLSKHLQVDELQNSQKFCTKYLQEFNKHFYSAWSGRWVSTYSPTWPCTRKNRWWMRSVLDCSNLAFHRLNYLMEKSFAGNHFVETVAWFCSMSSSQSKNSNLVTRGEVDGSVGCSHSSFPKK